ncbi:hypothetical protein RhiXN_05495 [Rhizoctonia solani]|uniref:Uncharacterized protein n=1 Tax=Rhizoctonia solani TaxID=456999 RepID=A0A8H8NUW4_9AGAM|nr:uncharacterized protein RhiXN_05495 [Rhizoctonia solani]QRW20506.1 hypothetical protein RhiXN_05495 [Rhizoctonia solani]
MYQVMTYWQTLRKIGNGHPWAKFTVCWTVSGSIMLNLDNLPVITYWKTLRKIGGGHPWAKFTVHWTVSGSIMLN